MPSALAHKDNENVEIIMCYTYIFNNHFMAVALDTRVSIITLYTIVKVWYEEKRKKTI